MAGPTNASREKMRSRPTGRSLSSCAETGDNFFFPHFIRIVFRDLITFRHCYTHQISFGGDRHQNKIVTYAHLLTLGSLLGGRVHGPPTRLTFENKTLRNSESLPRTARFHSCFPWKIYQLYVQPLNFDFISILSKVIKLRLRSKLFVNAQQSDILCRRGEK